VVSERDVYHAKIRNADREVRRLGRKSPPRDRAGTASVGRARDRGSPHDAGRAAGHPRQRRVPQRRLLDVLPRGGRSAATGVGPIGYGPVLSRVLVQASGGSVRVSEATLSEIVRRAVASVEGARLRKGR